MLAGGSIEVTFGSSSFAAVTIGDEDFQLKIPASRRRLASTGRRPRAHKTVAV